MDGLSLADFLIGQRWFAGKGRSWELVDASTVATLRDHPRVELWLLTVRYDDGSTEVYQLPLVHHSGYVDQLSHVLVGEREDENGVKEWVYDALHDKEVTDLWTRGIAEQAELGAVRFRAEPSAPEVDTSRPSLVISAEQSNTSLVYGDTAILKVFRKIAHGLNPDIEVHRALSRAGSSHVAALLGWVEGTWTDPLTGAGGTGNLAMLQEFLRGGVEGWEMARASVRDLFAEGDLHAEEVGGDFAGEAQRLGVVTAEVHADLARGLPTAPAGRSDLEGIAAGMQERLQSAARAVPELRPYAAALGSAYDAVPDSPGEHRLQRVHGDLHLGQVMRSVSGWKLLDFEGEPARPLAERRRPDLPVRDVAGMLRSFDYAARQSLVDRAEDRQLDYRAQEWADRNRAAFCVGYGQASGRDPRQDAALLRAYEIDKAVYEVVYEARNRPTWLPVPMAAVTRLASS